MRGAHSLFSALVVVYIFHSMNVIETYKKSELATAVAAAIGMALSFYGLCDLHTKHTHILFHKQPILFVC